MATPDSVPLVLGADDGSGKTSASMDAQDKPTLLMMVVNAFCNIRYKSLFFLFVLFILITSDVFINILLKKLNGTVDDRNIPTPYGTVIQGFVLVLGYMILNFFIEKELI